MTTVEPHGGVSLAEYLGATYLLSARFQVLWKPDVSDIRKVGELAERWVSETQTWHRAADGLHFFDQPSGFRSDIWDGSADLLTWLPLGFERGLGQFGGLIEKMGEQDKRPPIRLRVHAQFLRPAAVTFEALQSRLRPKMLASGFPGIPGTDVLDWAYLADMTVDGQWFQLNIGPVKKNELQQRLQSQPLDPPEVATFCNVIHRWTFKSPSQTLRAGLDNALNVGRIALANLE